MANLLTLPRNATTGVTDARPLREQHFAALAAPALTLLKHPSDPHAHGGLSAPAASSPGATPTMNAAMRRSAFWAASACLVVLAAASTVTPAAAGLYNWNKSKVVQLTEKNFQSLVLDSKETWYVCSCCVGLVLLCLFSAAVRPLGSLLSAA